MLQRFFNNILSVTEVASEIYYGEIKVTERYGILSENSSD